MLKTLDHVEGLLSQHGYSTTRMLDVIVATTVPTKTYINTAGEQAIELVITFDRGGDCLALEVLRAFDLRKTIHKEATMACLLAATARTPLLRPSLDPADGEIRLRIDCPCGVRGARDGDLLRAVSLLPWFADNISPQISAAMEKGCFDPNEVRRFHLPKLRAKPARPAKPPNKARKPVKKRSPPTVPAVSSPRARVEALAKKPGCSPGRLTRLYAFHQWLASLKQQQLQQDATKQTPTEDSDPPNEKKENKHDGHDA